MRTRGLAEALLVLVAVPAASGQSQLERHRVSSPIALYDDADPAPRGTLSVGSYFAYGKFVAGQDTSAPSLYLNLGVHRRFDVSGDVAFVRSEFERSRVNGIGDSYFGAKILILSEGRRRPALAVKPMIEILGRPSIADNVLAPSRVNFVPSLLAQKSFDNYRVYYMGGYITRGILFQSLGWEWNRWSRITPVAILSTSRLTQELRLVGDLGLNRSRSDVAGGATIAITRTWSVYGMAGRSFGREDLNSAHYQLTGGVNFNLRLWGEK